MQALIKSPCAPLTPFVERLWFFDNYFDAPYTTRVVPKINPFVTICLGDLPHVVMDDTDMRQSAPWSINGLLDKSGAALQLSGNMRLVGIELKPHTPFYMTGYPSEEFVNDHVCLSHFLKKSDMDRLVEQVSDMVEPWAILNHVERLLLDVFKVCDLDRATSRMVPVIEALSKCARPEQRIDVYARESAMSTRNFQRQFKRIVGISPKSWMDKIRLNRLIESLRSQTHISLEGCAYEYGFSDLSHMYRFFKKYKLVPPAQLRNEIASVDKTMLNYSF